MDAGFQKLLKSKTKFRLYLLANIPSAYFSGLNIEQADANSCSVSIPFKWFTKNPFRSTYFACLGMAAEMSTGILAMAAIYKKDPPVSMLVVGMESQFHKKATGRTIFTCTEGQAIRTAIQNALETNEPQTVRINTKGTNQEGDEIAQFYITWSFKVKTTAKSSIPSRTK